MCGDHAIDGIQMANDNEPDVAPKWKCDGVVKAAKDVYEAGYMSCADWDALRTEWEVPSLPEGA